MYYIITIINIYAALAAIAYLYIIIRDFEMSFFLDWYIYFTITSMIYMVLVNIDNLSSEERDWKLPITSLLWAGKTIYFCWAIQHGKSETIFKPKKENDGDANKSACHSRRESD